MRTAEYEPAGRLRHWTDTRYSPGTPVTVCQDPTQIAGEGCVTVTPTEETILRDSTYSYDAVGNAPTRARPWRRATG